MANEDFTGYTEVDPDSDLTVTASKILVVDNDRDDGVTSVYDDKGAAHFDADFEHLFEVYPDSSSENGGEQAHWLLANSSAGYYDARENGKCLVLFLLKQPTANTRFYLRQYDAGSGEDTDLTSNMASNVLYFVTIARDDDLGSFGQLVLTLRTGSHTGTLKDTLTIDMTEAVDFRYIYGYSNLQTGTGGDSVYGYTQNLDLQEAAATGNPWNSYAQQ